MTKVLMVAPNVRADRVEELRKAYPDVEFVVPESREDVPALIADADAVFGSITADELQAPNIIITPHNSPTSKLTTGLVWSMLADGLGRFERGEALANTVNKRAGY